MRKNIFFLVLLLVICLLKVGGRIIREYDEETTVWNRGGGLEPTVIIHFLIRISKRIRS